MTAVSISALLTDTIGALDRLQRQYDAIARAQPGAPDKSMIAEFAAFLRNREARTLAALRGYLERDEDLAALEVRVRLGAAFPFVSDELELPEHPTLDELAAIAERSDELLGQLPERVQVYAVSGALTETLAALADHVESRRRELADALNELEGHRPSPQRARG